MFRKILISIPFSCIFLFLLWTCENYAMHGSEMQYYVLDLKTMFTNLNTNLTETITHAFNFLMTSYGRFSDYVNIDDTLTSIRTIANSGVINILTLAIYIEYIFKLIGQSVMLVVGFISYISVGFTQLMIACLNYVLLLFKFIVNPSWTYMKPSINPYSFDPSSWVWSESSPLIPESYWGSI
jgi:FlaA1/EpsC-like NDP-sugar epimerase